MIKNPSVTSLLTPKSGKSSLVLTILRLLSVRSGSITIDGVDISSIPLVILRSRITTIPQEPVFLPGSIRYNIDPHCHSNDEDITMVLCRVELLSIVESLGGLNTDIAQLPLSHSQRQMLCLARAMLATTKILILDEASSSMDGKTEALMKDILTKEFKDCTILAIAHRMDLITGFDRVLVMDAGRVKSLDVLPVSEISTLIAANEQ